MYGDHHVVEVRRILLEIPGVEDVYASSSFRAVEVTYDPEKVNDLEIQLKLDEAGYLGEWTIIAELGVAVARNQRRRKFPPHSSIRANQAGGQLCSERRQHGPASLALSGNGCD
jgi:copper chaperone CopZ